jgi:hypothetical protein
MENRCSNVQPSGKYTSKTNKAKAGLTPRELIRYHMNNPDEPIRDEDIENLILNNNTNYIEDKRVDTAAGAADKRMLSAEEIKQIQDSSITTPYNVLR